LLTEGYPVPGRTDWPRGGGRIYFRDPDGHLLELAGLWRIY
jgi:catechol 2,3-dioxygenase-like lactoylglutathione lyase family enzyme